MTRRLCEQAAMLCSAIHSQRQTEPSFRNEDACDALNADADVRALAFTTMSSAWARLSPHRSDERWAEAHAMLMNGEV